MAHALTSIEIAPCGTYHHKNDRPLYAPRFLSVLKYHEPGLAPVLDHEGAFHITLNGRAAYPQKYCRTFGFYDNRAAVHSKEGWFHIYPDGSLVYPERYAWCGNFQEGFCTVQNLEGQYLHITRDGSLLYPETYTYVGDFKDGTAVICNEEGKHTHIDRQGHLIHHKWFDGLDVFHKGFARAKDTEGWFHITLEGKPAYKKRYAHLEPFYNGLAHGEDFQERLLLINEKGEEVKELFAPKGVSSDPQALNDLSSDMVGFWKTWALYAACELNVLESLPASISSVSQQTAIAIPHLERLFRALWEIDIIQPEKESWVLTPKGRHLVPSMETFMSAASFMWGEVNKAWQHLPSLLKQSSVSSFPSFKDKEENPAPLEKYQRALNGYAQKDFSRVSSLPEWKKHKRLAGFGRSSFYLLLDILEQHSHLKGTLFGPKKTLELLNPHPFINKRLFQKEWSLGSSFHVLSDGIIFPKFLHYFSDTHVKELLTQARRSLVPGGTLYVFEMILQKDSPVGGLLDLNMMCESGGQLRSMPQWEKLLSGTKLAIDSTRSLSPFMTLLQITPSP